MGSLVGEDCDWPGQVGRGTPGWYQPHLERLYDAPMVRVDVAARLREMW